MHPNPKLNQTPIRVKIYLQNQNCGYRNPNRYPKPALYDNIVIAIRNFYEHIQDIYTHIHMYKQEATNKNIFMGKQVINLE